MQTAEQISANNNPADPNTCDALKLLINFMKCREYATLQHHAHAQWHKWQRITICLVARMRLLRHVCNEAAHVVHSRTRLQSRLVAGVPLFLLVQ